jgi:hypothetical protein
MISLPEIILKDIDDPYVLENFKRLKFFLQDFPLFRGEWHFLQVTLTSAVTNKKIAHGLGFKPLDIIQTSKIGAGDITFNFSSFDAVNIDVTTTGACVVRCFIGAYKEESGRSGR